MSNITRKLRSKRGGSMIIAMVFMIFCVFIGGTVLAAASANGYRVAHLSDQQDYLDQRSAAMLLANEMEIPSGSSVRLIVKDAKTVAQPVYITEAGVEYTYGTAAETNTLTFEVPSGLTMSAIQRIMFETTVLRYLEENAVASSVPKTLSFTYDSGTASTTSDDVTVTAVDQFWCTAAEGTIDVTGTRSDNSGFASYEATYACGEGDGLYDFIVGFDEFSQLTVTMNGFSSTTTQTGQPQYVAATAPENAPSGYEYYTRYTTVVERTTISWNDPVIAKGGAEE